MTEFDTILADYDSALLKMQRQQTDLLSKLADMQQEIVRKNNLLAHQARMTMLGEVTASVAHEIRNPLGGIRLYLDLICREGGLQESPHVLKIRAIVSRLDRVVTGILHHSREIKPQCQSVALTNVVMDAVSLAESELETGQIKLTVNADEGTVSVDPDLFSQLLLNLIMNAAQVITQSGTSGASIVVSARLTPTDAIFTVQDNGPGIEEEQIQHLFTPFFSNKEGGTGLGLALCKRIAEAHNGRIQAQNTTPGARFTVTIGRKLKSSSVF